MASEKKLKKDEIYTPSEEVKNGAIIKDYDKLYARSISNREEFWAEQAESLDWFKKWDTVLDKSNAPFFKWYSGGKINIIYNAIDRHLTT